MIEHIIPDGVPAGTLDRYLRRAWPMLPSHVLRDLFKKKDVRVNGVRSDGRATVRGGDALAIYADDKWFAPSPDILWTDDRLIVAVKPQGLPVDVDRDGVGADTLLTRLRRRFPDARLCHRLDAATGGIVLAANDDVIYAQALEAFRSHGVRKRYHALALRPFDRDGGTLRAWLLKDARRAEVRVVHHSQPGARLIETRYRVGDAAAPGLFNVWLEPVTGRTHQLRAHMADFGHPLLGDDKYGDRAANRQFPNTGLCLWHERLAVPDDSPLTRYRGQVFDSPAPKWL
ncbi:MAG: RluA family pseudouridine synthase [Clostridia bacterium]|nr:RluA family pseudouridine synthase [Clostridia bacterium]